MGKLTDKEVLNLLHSLVNSGDLKLKVNIKDNLYEYIATSTLTYKGQKIISVKNVQSKPRVAYEKTM